MSNTTGQSNADALFAALAKTATREPGIPVPYIGQPILQAQIVGYHHISGYTTLTSQQYGNMFSALNQFALIPKLLNAGQHILNCIEHADGAIGLSNDYAGVLVLNMKHVPSVCLFHFVDVLDEVIDYNEISERIPGISFHDIYNGIQFLRRVSEYNRAGIDVQDLEDRADAENDDLVEQLRRSLRDKEITHVLGGNE